VCFLVQTSWKQCSDRRDRLQLRPVRRRVVGDGLHVYDRYIGKKRIILVYRYVGDAPALALTLACRSSPPSRTPHGPSWKPPFLVVKHTPRPYKSAIQNRFKSKQLRPLNRPRAGPNREVLPALQLLVLPTPKNARKGR
jgi:hypothetical protein